MRLPMTGGCQCGAVRYEIGARPLTLYACHCTGCQRQSGSAFGMSLFVPRDAVRFVAGEPLSWHRVTESGRTQSCPYCGACGSRLLHLPDANPAVAVLKPGTLDDTSWLRPVAHIWTERAQPWFRPEPGTLVYRRVPDSMAELFEAGKRAFGGDAAE